MSVDKYKFVSPGVFVSEIDNTGRSATAGDIGPALIGRAEKGPMLKPTQIDSMADFVNVFGNPIPGGKGGDVARDGNYTSPTYAPYAAQAWFRNNSPVTFVRLGGQAHAQASDDGGKAGWQTTDSAPGTSYEDNGGAYGLFISDTPTQSAIKIVVADAAAVGDTVLFEFGGQPEQTITCVGGATTATQFTNGANKEDTAAGIVACLTLNTAYEGTATIDPDDDAIVILTPDSTLPTLLSASFKVNTPGSDYKLTNDGVDVANNVDTYIQYSSVTGTLAGVWYIDQSASIALSGTKSDDGTIGKGTSIYIDSVGNKQFKVQITSSVNGVSVDSAFNFTPSSDQYIRKVFNTNPILTNTAATDVSSDAFVRYWLGESYEGAVNEAISSTSQVGVILPLLSGSVYGGVVEKDYQPAETGYFIAQDTTTGLGTGSFDAGEQQQLFKLVCRNNGDWVSRNLKVSIKEIKSSVNTTANPYGSFSVVIRKMSDTDNRVEFVEQFNNCNLNPTSENFIGRKIGDRYETWDDASRRYIQYGDYPNRSRYIYVDMPAAVKKGDTDAAYLPFGVKGPTRFKSFNDAQTPGQKATMVSGSSDDYGSDIGGVFISGSAGTDGALTYSFPKLRLRQSASEGKPVDPLNSYYGVDTTYDTTQLDRSVLDHLKTKPTDSDTADLTVDDFVFTLDDMCYSGAEADKIFVYLSGSRQMDVGGTDRGALTYLRGTGSFSEVLNAGVDRFTTVFAGGFDGLNVKESEPFRTVNTGDDNDVTTNYAYNSVQVAIDSLRDPEVVEYDLVAMPGLINNTLNETLFNMCEDRGDALAVIDLKYGYTPEYESTLDAADRRGSVDQTIEELKTLTWNTNYGCAYYPWVQIRDLNNGQLVWAPPSIAALGAMSYGQKASELWFAPAGFTRGGLSAGKAGLPVVAVRERLTSKQRDKLYDNNINPIAQFPAEGIVIFGQKTLQVTPSALDRINVRRLMIFLKRQISRFAATILFDQNVRVTWNRFKGRVEPFLRGVQAGLGITAFKMVLDDTTTTPDLVDRNIVYAKIYLKPARSIEYIAIDFILTDSGAAFED